MHRPRFVSPLGTWFPGPAALARFRASRLGRTPFVLHPRDRAWRAIAPDFTSALAMARTGAPFQIALDRRYDRTGDPRRLRAALGRGATIFMPQVHHVLPRLARLMVALRAGLLGPLREETSFLFIVEGRSRPGMGLHHDGAVDAFWLQLEGRRTVTLGPPVRPGTPSDLEPARALGGRGWRTFELPPGTLLYLPPWTPHNVVCHERSLALSLTWATRGPRARRASLPVRRASLARWEVVSGRVDATPAPSRSHLWTQVPVVAGPLTRDGFELVTPDETLQLPAAARHLACRLALMPRFPPPRSRRSQATLAPLLAHGIVAPQDLPLRIRPDEPRALDGWRFA
jgi:hypothetical protein